MSTIVKDKELKKVAELVKLDARNRVVLPKALVRQGIYFTIYTSSTGQIILEPQASIPASELWVFENKEILASIDKGVAESTKGQLTKRSSYAKHSKNAS